MKRSDFYTFTQALQEIQRVLGEKNDAVYLKRLITNGKIPAYRHQDQMLIKKADLNDFFGEWEDLCWRRCPRRRGTRTKIT